MVKVDMTRTSYQICMESFNAMMLEQDPSDRMGYKDAAMEAITGPDAGMVIEKLYKSLNARSGINFGRIPDSMGDLTAFQKYKAIEDTFILLDRDIGPYKVDELKLAHDLHDNLIRLRGDFQFGFKTDSQFLKITYNNMVYSLCELLNLCTVIYIDILKAATTGTQFKYVPYNDLLLVQNVRKFNKMVTSGEWAQMTTQIIKGAKNLTGNSQGSWFNGDWIGGLTTILLTGNGLIGAAGDYIKDQRAAGNNISVADAAKAGIQGVKNMPGQYKSYMTQKGHLGGKVALTVAIVIAALFIIRTLVNLFWRATYSLRDILADNEKLLAANMEASSDNTKSSLEKQQFMYNALSGMREKIEGAILSDDKKGKKNLKEANATDLPKEALTSSIGDASVTFG